MIFNTVESFHNKSFFYSGRKKFWVVQKVFPTVTKLIIINVKKKANSFSAFDLYTTVPRKFLLKELSEVNNFVIKLKVRKRIGFSKATISFHEEVNICIVSIMKKTC